jgi:hypothetical protein
VAEKHPKRPRDLNQWAKRMLDIATGEASDLKTTPAMAAGVTDRLWGVADMVEVLEAWEST